MKKEWRGVQWMVPVAIFTLLCFLPILQVGFFHWDDDGLFVQNFYFRGLSFTHWQWMSSTFLLGHWQPLSWLSYALDYTAWGMNPQAWHVSNLLLHCVNAMLVYWVCLACLGSTQPGVKSRSRFACCAAALAALFWSVHPLRVEAAAWLATRGYLLCTSFCLLTVLFYLRAVGQRRYPLAALLWFTLATFTKGIGMMLPPVLLLIDWVLLRRITSVRTAVRCAIEKSPFFALSLLTGITAFLAKQMQGGMAPADRYALADRFGQALYGIWFYLLKIVLPLKLSPLYYKWPDAGALLIALLLTMVTAVSLFLFRHRLRPLIAALGAFLLLIFPMLGFTQSGAQAAADRFTYLAAIPLSVLLAAGLIRLPVLRKLVCGSLATLLLIFGIQTAVFSVAWCDDLTLWNYALSVDPLNARAHNLAGVAFLNWCKYERALEQFNYAIELSPGLYPAYQNRAQAWVGLGEFEKAAVDVSKGLSMDGLSAVDRVKMYIGRGQIFEKTGQLDRAIQDYSAVIEDRRVTSNWHAMALQARARLYLQQGNVTGCQADLETVLSLPDPGGNYREAAGKVLEEIKKIPGV